jgi:ferric-dicitrate binding protein FerR (iron transport regulator)
VFRSAQARDVIAELSRAYDVEIRLGDSAVASQRLTWMVQPKRQSSSEVFDQLAELLGAHVTRNHRVITIVPGRAPTAPAKVRIHPQPVETSYGR